MALIKCCFASEPIEIEIPDFLESVVKNCTNQSCCCGCCSALRPKYKSLVDNIFPANPEDGLVKSNMEKLTFYSLRSPEKLDRIGEYLYQKASKDINRKRYKLVEIAMEAMDQLLMACHAHSLNLFVESFLRMVQKLLEDANPNLQIMATSSFVKFANIEEDTPSYHRRYDFFISKFSSMCHSSYDDVDINNSIRMAGIKGLQGVIRKTVSDDLVENIWDKQHMEKIVPSLLYNMQTGSQETIQEEHQSTPPLLAEAVLRELVSRASFGHIKAVLKPLLKHLDNHELWVPHKFAIHTFRIVMLSIQPQYSYTVVETLMTHLDANQSSSPKTKTSLAVVLSKIISIAAGESVGPSALDIINNLLTHVRTSVGTKHSLTGEETQYQDALINALGEFANHHPDYQKIEIMLFIMNTVPDLSKRNKEDILLQNILLKCLLKVGVQYRTVSFEKAFPASFMHPLLKMARSPQIPTRITVMQILQQLLDRHQNQDILNMVSIKNYATLSLETPSRSDILFTHKHGANMMQALIEAMSMDDNIEALVSVYNTAALMVCEMVCTETISEFLLYVLGVQQVSITATEMTPEHRANLHCIAISLLALLGRCTGITSIIDYTEKVIESRKEDALYLLPPLNAADSQTTINLEVPHLMLDKLALVECLQSAGIDHIRLQAATPYSLVQYDPGHRQSWVDTGIARASVTDIGSNDVDSVSSSPGVQRKPLVMELNFESMKRVLTEPVTDQKEKKKEKQKETVRTFREYNFDDLVKHTETKHDMIQNKLNELFNSLTTSYGNPVDGYLSPTTKQNQQKKVYENHFPELFFY